MKRNYRTSIEFYSIFPAIDGLHWYLSSFRTFQDLKNNINKIARSRLYRASYLIYVKF